MSVRKLASGRWFAELKAGRTYVGQGVRRQAGGHGLVRARACCSGRRSRPLVPGGRRSVGFSRSGWTSGNTRSRPRRAWRTLRSPGLLDHAGRAQDRGGDRSGGVKSVVALTRRGLAESSARGFRDRFVGLLRLGGA